MAYGNATVLKLPWDVLQRVVERIQPGTWRDPDEDSYEWELDILTDVKATVDPQLQAAQRSWMRARHGTVSVIAGTSFAGYYHVVVNGEPRTVAPASLKLHDGGEMGMGWPHGVHVGVELISRYVPSWLDLDEKHGGSHLPVTFDAAFQAEIDSVRDVIAKDVPEFRDSVAGVVPTWY